MIPPLHAMIAVALPAPLSKFLALPVVAPIKTMVLVPVWGLLNNMVFTVGFVVALTITMVASHFRPADRTQRLFGVSFWQDLVWFFYETVLNALVITTYVYWLHQGYQACCSRLTIEAALTWPTWLRFVVGFAMLDFLYWLQHVVNHRVPMFWEFHKVHHSQTHLSFFSDFRYHVFEYLVRQTILTIPFLLLAVPIPTIVGISLVLRYYTRFYHGNIRSNLGPLRYLLVTPQSHRVHHSIHVQHHDTNYGSVLSIWDRLFGTHYHGEDEYPETGITDDEFPLERSRRIDQLVLTPLVQMLYPVRVLGRRVVQALSGRA